MTGPRYTELAESLPATVPFVGPEAQERGLGRSFAARIGANESVFGPSPRAIAAMQKAAAEVWQYADPENHDLREALASHHRVEPENIVVGEGIDALLGYLVRLLVGPGCPVVTSAGAYPTFNYHVTGFGGKLHTVPYRGDAEDPDALVDRAREVGARIIYFANPDNPMGSWHDAARVETMIEAVPEGTVLCLDEAYVEFAPGGTAPSIDITNPRVIRMRTFSKAHGMAGARIGYAIAESGLARAFNKIRNHFGVNRVAQTGALAALADQGWVSEVRGKVRDALDRIAKIGASHGLTALPTATNFVALDTGRNGEYARALVGALARQGVFVRMPFVAPQDRCIRVSAGRAADLDALEAGLPKALATIA